MVSRRTANWYPGSLADDPIVLADGTWDLPFLAGATGLSAPQYALGVRTSPGVPGARFESSTAKPRTITLPILIGGATSGEYRARRDLIVDAVASGEPGWLELSADIGDESGAVRVCRAVYVAGLDGNEAPTSSGVTWWRPTITLQLLDAYWSDIEPTVASWAGPTAVPFLPFDVGSWMLSPDGVTVDVPLVLDGSATVDAWPTWTLAGPFYRVRVEDPRTGLWWQVDRDVPAGELVQVVCDPAEVGVTDTAGASAFAALVGGSVLFPLRPGDAPTVHVDGADTATVVTCSVSARWLTAP